MQDSFDNAIPSRWTIYAQLGIVLFLIEGALWTHGRTQAYWFVSGFAALIICVLLSRPKVSELGLGLRGLAGASLAIPISLLFSALTLFIAWKLGTLRTMNGTVAIPWHAFFYFIWALEQEFILNAFFYKRFEWLMGNTTGALVTTALLFSLVHLPNPVLVPATFLGGLFFVGVFRKFRNIYPLAIAHAVLGLTMGMAFPDSLIRHMRVGIAFVRFHAKG